MTRDHKLPGPDHPISIDKAQGLTVAMLGETIIAASCDALVLVEADYPPVTYFPASSVVAAVLSPSAHETWCPYKGQAAYDDVADRANKAWRYYDPFPAVAPIAGRIAFYPDAVTVETRRLPGAPDAAERVLDFWFEAIPPSRHFNSDPAFDREIADLFGRLHAEAVAGDLDGWAETPEGGLALLILLDQFSRNIHRGEPEAFAQDAKALAIAETMLERGFDLALTPEPRAFVYLPFMHDETIASQNRCVALFQDRLPGSKNLPFALSHRQEIHRHGRFVGRDEALGR